MSIVFQIIWRVKLKIHNGDMLCWLGTPDAINTKLVTIKVWSGWYCLRGSAETVQFITIVSVFSLNHA